MTDDDVLAAMHRYGGSFVRGLAALYHLADDDNRRRLRLAFPETWASYIELAERVAERKPCACGCGRLVAGGLMEVAHPDDYRDERG
jgi:hypothetical protein